MVTVSGRSEDRPLSVAFDHAIFAAQRRGGVSRYFCELASSLRRLVSRWPSTPRSMSRTHCGICAQTSASRCPPAGFPRGDVARQRRRFSSRGQTGAGRGPCHLVSRPTPRPSARATSHAASAACRSARAACRCAPAAAAPRRAAPASAAARPAGIDRPSASTGRSELPSGAPSTGVERGVEQPKPVKPAEPAQLIARARTLR